MPNDIIKGMGFGHMAVGATDFDKSMAFYQALGYKLYTQWGEGDSRIALLDIGDGNKLELFVAGIVMACAIALHNVPEGMTIGASYASNNGVMGSAALVLAILIGLHNIPEGMAVSVPLITGGMSRAKAVFITALSGAPTIIGALLGYLLGEIGAMGLALSLGFASGAMLYVVFGEILPQAILMYHSKLPAFSAIIGMLVGLFVIFN